MNALLSFLPLPILLSSCFHTDAGTPSTHQDDPRQSAAHSSRPPMTEEHLKSWFQERGIRVTSNDDGDIVVVGAHLPHDTAPFTGPFSGVPAKRADFNRKVISALAALPHLETLRLHSETVEDADFANVRGFKSLKELDLSETNVGDKALHAFRDSRKLEKLRLDWTQRIGRALEAIPADSLRELTLIGPEVRNENLKSATRFHKLRDLGIGSPLVTNDGIMVLSKLRNLKRLAFYNCTRVDGDGTAELIKRLPPCFVTKSFSEPSPWESKDPPVQEAPSRSSGLHQ